MQDIDFVWLRRKLAMMLNSNSRAFFFSLFKLATATLVLLLSGVLVYAAPCDLKSSPPAFVRHERMESNSGQMEELIFELNIQENEWLDKWYKWQLH